MAWRPLQISPSAGAHLPPLLVSAVFTNEAYQIYLTDLTCIWGESLDRRAIIRRSREEGTSIDPSDGDQFKIFISKIKLALEGGVNTTLALTINQVPDRPSLTLKASVALPGGLAPLSWPVRLAASPQSQLTAQLIVPLLQAQHVRMQETVSLVEALKEKDHVVQKLMDKLESLGAELGDIFPQAAGKGGRKVDRKKAEERVRGLSVFDMTTWKQSLKLEISRDTAHLMGQVFAKDYTEPASADDDLGDEGQDSWWEGIKGITVNLGSGKISTNGTTDKPKATPPTAVKQQDSIDEDDDFQVQSTPPYLSKTIKASKEDSSTDDEEDLDAPSQRSKIPDSYPMEPPPPSPPMPKKKLGMIGKKAPVVVRPPIEDDGSTEDDEEEEAPQQLPRRAAKRTTPTPELAERVREDEASSTKTSPPIPEKVPAKSVRKLGKIGGKKEAPPPPEPEVEPEREPTPQPVVASPTPVEAPKPKKGKLGKIGGKKKAVDSEPEPEAAPLAPIDEPEVASPPMKRKIGTIGGHKPAGAAETGVEAPVKAEEESQNRGRASTRPRKDKTPEPRETSVERASRRRAELKKELEEKAKAPPKKKRKF